jgi:hypothetical protein
MLGIISCIIGAICLFFSFCLWLSRKTLAENKVDYFARMIVFFVIALIGFGVGIYAFANENDSSFDNSPTYNNQTHQSHECYVCGKDASLKYGSHYYCNTHGAMVKTVVEAD